MKLTDDEITEISAILVHYGIKCGDQEIKERCFRLVKRLADLFVAQDPAPPSS